MSESQAQNLSERFWKFVKKSDDCWNWIGANNGNGYGEMSSHGRKLFVHRVSWQLAYGAIPKGMFVLHRCDNRRCVRPDHLFLGTQAENLQDMRNKGRQAVGEQSNHNVLTAELVREIRKKYIPHKYGYQRLSQEFGINWNTIRWVIQRKSWKHIP